MRRENFRILIVDNDEQIVRLLRTILESRHYSCASAYGGTQALSRFHSDPPDLVITDLEMTVGHGATFIESIRKAGPTPVIVVSGFARDGSDLAESAANIWVMPKPIDISGLLQRVRRCCRHCCASQPRVPRARC
jgi:DNA-binding response OmpR family regulator